MQPHGFYFVYGRHGRSPAGPGSMNVFSEAAEIHSGSALRFAALGMEAEPED